jgi:hypothetical protein
MVFQNHSDLMDYMGYISVDGTIFQSKATTVPYWHLELFKNHLQKSILNISNS